MSWAQAATFRVRRQHLHRRARSGSLLDVARRLCGLHAQLMSSAELSAWARVEGFDRSALPRALWEERTLVKTWAMRGTLHLLPSDELPLWHAALATNRHFLRAAVWQRYFGISLEDLDRLTEAIAVALEGRLLTREELGREVVRLTGSASLGAKMAKSSWGTMLRPAAFSGCLCFAPSVGPRVRFTRPDTWIRTRMSRVDPAGAGPAIARRFLTAYGPATYADLARWWTGGGIATARRWIDGLGGEVVRVDLEGAPAWILAADRRELRDAPLPRSARLLPAFDPYVVAASPHAAHLLPGDLRARVYRGQGWLSPVLLVNGRMDGVWRHEIKGSRVEIVVEPFVKVPTWVRRGVEDEAERLAAFFGSTASVRWRR